MAILSLNRLYLILTIVTGFVFVNPLKVKAEGELSFSSPVSARLISSASNISRGNGLTVALELNIAPGWYVYWRNPGDAGLPPKIDWQMPTLWQASEFDWPAPERFISNGLTSIGYQHAVILPLVLTAPATAPLGTVIISGTANWLVCSNVCVPGESSVSITLTVVDETPPHPPQPSFLAVNNKPFPTPAPFTVQLENRNGLSLSFQLGEARKSCNMPGLSLKALFLPYSNDAGIALAKPQHSTIENNLFSLAITRINENISPPKQLEGILALWTGTAADPDTKACWFEIKAYSENSNQEATHSLSHPEQPTVWAALGLALLGGIILNFMPCVFPILSLKMLAIRKQRKENQNSTRINALSYAAGVVISFLVFGLAILLLRSTGTAIGWGFQLQSPALISTLIYLLTFTGFGLSGWIELTSRFSSAGDRFTRLPGTAGAFGTGVLAALVASPCTAPYMAVALGYALIAPFLVGIAIFGVLGFGLALPLVLMSFLPVLQRLLPSPGPWMNHLKQVLAFPLYGTVVWLLFVLEAEAGAVVQAQVMAGLVLLGLAVWLWRTTAPSKRVGRILAFISLLTALAISPLFISTDTPPTTSEACAETAYSSAKITELLEMGKPVFVNITARWCITCLINERTTLDTNTVRKAFNDLGITYLIGDWTSPNPEVEGLLNSFGRAGVPLYIYYPKNKADPVILPQLLSPKAVLAAINHQ